MEMLSNKLRTRMIRWRLRVIMAEKNINNKTLASRTGIHPTTISRLKNTDELKQITGEVLDALCGALECTPNDLIEFTPGNLPETSGFMFGLNPTDFPKKKKKKSSIKDQIEDLTRFVA